MRKILKAVLLLCASTGLYAQDADSVRELNLVTVTAYLSQQPLLSLPSSAITLGQLQIEQKVVNSLIPLLNSVSGVRMEERSPGSYRLSIRGSLLRSPFGVRNIKVYFDGFPLTDAGGNTYLNLIAPSGIRRMEILKGPDGSIFGANSGGVLLMETLTNQNELNVNFKSGSYGLFNQSIGLQNKVKKWNYSISEEYQQAKGYRDHSSMSRKYLQTQAKYNYGLNNEFKFSGFYSDLEYETPGGLTLGQLNADPKASRPATPVAPGSAQQKAAIYNESFFGGVSNRTAFSKRIANVTGVSTIHTNYENPFITNYETRVENSIAVRSYFELKNLEARKVNMQANVGWEYQNTNSDIINYDNKLGVKGAVQAADRIKATQQFVFGRVSMQAGDHLKAEAALSLNFFGYDFGSLPESTSSINGTRSFDRQFMPRFAISYLFNTSLALRGTLSRGYSTPTIAEVRASDAKINSDIDAETGWNYELGLRLKDKNERFYADLSAFSYRLQNAIVRRVNALDQDYFVNAGGTKQVGLELQANYILLSQKLGVLREITINSALTLSDFSFSNYRVGSSNFTGNKLTGVPNTSIVNGMSMSFAKNFSLYTQYQYTSDIPLNDANAVFAQSYHLLSAKIGWNVSVGARNKLELSVGADNILNKNYSLGNDINAFGNRFYNAAPLRNYFVGLKLIR